MFHQSPSQSSATASGFSFDVESPYRESRPLERSSSYNIHSSPWFTGELSEKQQHVGSTARRRGRMTTTTRASSLPAVLDLNEDHHQQDDDYYDSHSKPRSRLYPVSASSAMMTTISTKTTVVFLLVVSWLICWWSISVARHELTSLQQRNLHFTVHMQNYQNKLFQLQAASREKEKQVEKAAQQQESLQHEWRVFSELTTAGVRMNSLPNNDYDDYDDPHNSGGGKMSQVVQDWLEHRLEGLKLQLRDMSSYLQTKSRLAVLEQYGPGPHRVQVTVERRKSATDTRRTRHESFVIEMASLEGLPHTVHFFLDLVRTGEWDNTVVLHHEEVDHVMLIMPVDFETQQAKAKYANGSDKKLAFPEYSHQHPHEKYTLGIGALGPAFYINTMNNVRWHGPGGQHEDSKLFPYDADPCFGRIIEGHDVVDSLIAFGSTLLDNKADSQDDSDSRPENWSRIVSMKLLL